MLDEEIGAMPGQTWYLPHHNVVNENKPEKLQNNETKDMLVYQSNAEGVDLFSYVNNFFAHWLYVTHFVPRNLGERSQTTHFLL